MTQNRHTYSSRLSPNQLFLTILIIVFIAELLVMFILESVLAPTMNHWIENFLDSFLLTLLSSPVLWWLIVRPLQVEAASGQAKYAAIVEAVVDGIISMNEEGIIESYNPAAEKIFGYSAEEMTGKDFLSLFDSFKNRQTNKSNDFISTYLENVSQKLVSYEILGRRKDNSVFPVEMSISNLILDDRKIYTAVIRDITKRKHAEEKIRQLSRAVEQSPSSVVITDSAGNIEYVNPKFTRLTGYDFKEVIGKNPRILKSGERPPEDYKKLWDIITSGEDWHGEFHNKKKNGDLYWEFASISPIINEKGKITHFLAVKEDITERKRQEDEIIRLNNDLQNHARELEFANKELQAFSYSVSHDLRSPITAINGYVYILLRDHAVALDRNMQDHLERIQFNCKRMKELIEDMLVLSHASRKEMELKSVNMCELAKSIIEELRNKQPGRNVQFVTNDSSIVNGDEGLLKILLDNLLGNAWKYSGKKENAVIEFGMQQIDGKPVYFVRDNGAGFNMEDAAKLFEPFQRLHSNSEFEGTGVGLATVYRVIQRHGGKIWAEAETEKGATFYFSLS